MEILLDYWTFNKVIEQSKSNYQHDNQAFDGQVEWPFASSLDLRVFSSRSKTDNRSFYRFWGWWLSGGLSGGIARVKGLKLTWILVIIILHDMIILYIKCTWKYILKLCGLYFVKWLMKRWKIWRCKCIRACKRMKNSISYDMVYRVTG